MQDGEDVAVKLLHLIPEQDDREQFKSEFEKLWRLNHPNIIQLLGYCYEVKHEHIELNGGRIAFAENIYRVLCFEYMHNGSLQKYIHGKMALHMRCCIFVKIDIV